MNQQFRWAWSVFDIKLQEIRGRLGRRRALAVLQGFGYVHDTVLAIVILPMLCLMMVTGWAEEPFGRLHSYPLLVLAIVTWITGRYKRLYVLDNAGRGGFQWRAAMLRASKWPRVLVAFCDALRGRKIEYLVTPKTANTRAASVLRLPIGAALIALLASWIAAIVLHRRIFIWVQVWTALLLLVGLALICSEAWAQVRRD
jgi:hypothetical protein